MVEKHQFAPISPWISSWVIWSCWRAELEIKLGEFEQLPTCSLWSHSLHVGLNWWNRTMAWWLDWSGLLVPKNPVWNSALFRLSSEVGNICPRRVLTPTHFECSLRGICPHPPTTRGREIGPNSPAFSHIYTSCLCTSVRLDGGKKERKEIHHFLASEGFECLVSELNTPLSFLLLAYTPSSLHKPSTYSPILRYCQHSCTLCVALWPLSPRYAPQATLGATEGWILGCDVGVWWEGRKWRPPPPAHHLAV